MEKNRKWWAYGLVVTLFVLLVVMSWLMYRYFMREERQPPEAFDDTQIPTAQEVMQEAEDAAWEYEKVLISSQIKDIDTTENKFQLNFSWPPSMPLHGGTKWVEMVCAQGDNVVEQGQEPGDSEEVVVLGTDIMGMAEVGDFMIGYCGDYNCDTFMRDCRLTKQAEE